MSLACALKSKNLKFPSFPTRFNRILSKPCYRTKYEVLERPKWLLRAFLNGHICCCNLLGGCKDSYDCDALKTVWEEPPGTASRQLSACFQKICRWCRWVYLNQHFLKWCNSAESFCTSSWSRTYLRFSPHKCGFDICFIPADSANVVQPQSYGLRTGRQKLGICTLGILDTHLFCIFVFKSLFMEGICGRTHAFSSLNVSQTQIQYTDVYTYTYIVPLSVFLGPLQVLYY